MKFRHSLIPVTAILGSVCCLALGTAWAKHSLFPQVGAQGTTAIRVGLSALILLVVCRPWTSPISMSNLRPIILYGVALGAMNLCFYMALRTIPFGIAVAIEFSGPLTVALLASRRLLDVVWVLFATVGIFILLPLGVSSSALDPVGVMFAIAAAFFWATYILFGKKASQIGAGVVVSLGLSTAAFVVVPLGVMHAGAALLAPHILIVGAGIALLSSAIPISLEMMALKRLKPQTFGILVSLEPAVAAIMAIALLDEQLSQMQWWAIALIVAASIGSSSAIGAKQTAST